MTAKHIFWIVGLAALLAVVGGAGWVASHLWSTQPSETARNGEQTRTDEEGVVCKGYVDLEHGIRALAPLHPGRVAKILAKENQRVSSGEPLLRLEDKDAKYQVNQAESALEAAQAQLDEALKLPERQRSRIAQQQAAIEAAGFRLESARRLLSRQEEELKKNLVTADEAAMTRDEVKALGALATVEREKLTELKTVDPALTARKARAEVKLAQTRLEQAKHHLVECTLKAPSAGIVERIQVGAGDIASGMPTQSIVRFRPDEAPLVRADVDQEFADRVKVGQTALIKDDARSSATWRGKVQRVAGWYERRRPTSQDPSAFTDVRTVECLISIDPGQPPLRIGQRMRVMIGSAASGTGD